jgi:hypothetical protein
MPSRRCLVLGAFLTASACGGGPTPAPQAPAPPAGTDTQLSTVLAAYRRAAGGEALDRIQRLRATGVSYTAGTKSNQRIVLQFSAPGKFRQYEAPVDEQSRQVVMVVGLDGTDGWRLGNTQLGGDGQSADPAVRARAETLASRPNNINALSGILPVLLRSDPVVTMTATPPAIAVSTKDGAAGRLIFDSATGLPRAFIAPYQRHIRPEGGEYTLTFSDFRVVDGVKLPFQITRTSDASPETRWAFRAYEINPEFPADTFVKPKK